MVTDDYPIMGDDVTITEYRHLDVDLYYRMGEKEKAQEIARRKRPVVVGFPDDYEIDDAKLRRVCKSFDSPNEREDKGRGWWPRVRWAFGMA